MFRAVVLGIYERYSIAQAQDEATGHPSVSCTVCCSSPSENES